jgi:hypothetical protein
MFQLELTQAQGGKSKATSVEKTKTASDIFHEKWIIAHLALTEKWKCAEHTISEDKPALCYKNPCAIQLLIII